MEILEIVAHLFERKSERKETLRRIVRKISREAFAADRSDLGSESIKRRFHVSERRRMPTKLQRGPDCAQVGGEGYADTCQKDGSSRVLAMGSGSGLMAVLPIMTRSCRNLSIVRNSGPVSGPAARPVDRLMLGLGALHSSGPKPGDPVLTAVQRIDVRPCDKPASNSPRTRAI